ncbi:recombinase family protein [Sporosarcina sp. FSL K6-3457]|uniref:recombinase family protein n=1 Tax=Sporosarcina sp. FSL K6-3457 TaxID=2978204 RepID=UPI0030F8DF8B
MTPEKKKAALYVRVSTMHQIDKDSLPFQRQELENYAKYALGIEDFVIFEDAGYSAKNTDRPKYQEMMERIRAGEFTHMIVLKIDRISRNLKDFSEMYEELKGYKITFVSKNEQFDTSTAMGEAMLKIILVFAELERKLTAERVFAIMLSRAEKGLWNGATVPLGYVWSDELKFPVVEPEESKVVQYIYDLYEEHSSTTKVAITLNDEHVPTKRGGQWTAKTVRDVLRNPFYIGTYRYNMRESEGSRRLKNEDEWIVLEDNHPGIIRKEQHRTVNQMLSDNYKGIGTAQRANIHTHIFAKLLYCSKCGQLLTAGLDTARKDGYRPSRYTCSTNRLVDNAHSCNNFISDIANAPFVFNYVSNLIRLQEKITPKHAIKDMERALLRGSSFIDVLGIDNDSLKETHAMFARGFDGHDFSSAKNNDKYVTDLATQRLQKEKAKFEKALSRLEDLYYFKDEGISQKDYIFKKRNFLEELEVIEKELNKLQQNQTIKNSNVFIDNAQHFLITKEMQQARNVNYRELLDAVGKDLLADFIQSVISKIVVADKRVQSITFKNGITHSFAYKPLTEPQKGNAPAKPLNKEYEVMVLGYLEENGSASRTDIESLVGMKRSNTLNLLKDLLDRDLIVKRGNSVAIRYYINRKDI